jgi:hypothetical protein
VVSGAGVAAQAAENNPPKAIAMAGISLFIADARPTFSALPGP